MISCLPRKINGFTEKKIDFLVIFLLHKTFSELGPIFSPIVSSPQTSSSSFFLILIKDKCETVQVKEVRYLIFNDKIYSKMAM